MSPRGYVYIKDDVSNDDYENIIYESHGYVLYM